MRVLIIGFGHLGYRHAQGVQKYLRSSKGLLDIFDINDKFWLAHNSEFKDSNINFLPSIPKFQNYDLAIVATNSIDRLEAVKNILHENKVKTFILEKFLFNNLNDYSEMNNLINAHKLKVFVNTPFRFYSFYQFIDKYLFDKKLSIVEMNVCGNANLGIGCNSIHYVNILKSLTGYPLTEVNTYGLKEVFKSKRAGYYEFLGKMKFYFNEIILKIWTDSSQNDFIVNFLLSNGTKINFSETTGGVNINGIDEIKRFPCEFQSELTALYLFNINKKKNLLLPSYEQIKDEHITILSALQTGGKLLMRDKHANINIT